MSQRTIPVKERLLCSVNDALDATGFSRTKLYSLRRRGLLLTVKVDGRTFVVVDSLKALASQGTLAA